VELDGILEKCDALLTPTVPAAAMADGTDLSPVKTYSADIFTVPASLAGVPAVSIPCGEGSMGLPLGLQLIGRPFDEKTILSFSLAFEKATDAKHLKSPKMGVCSL
jgi:aspartyl-tRNA(Asn)/glutamyl-tRNA(Gln) amidotransferase subunit A